MERLLMSRKMMPVTFMVLPFLAARPVLAQDTLELDLEKVLEIIPSENLTVRVTDKEIQKKKYTHKGSYTSLFPQISFAGDYNHTLKKQVMYMDFNMGNMGGGNLPENTGMSSMDEGFKVGRSNNWDLGFNASMPLMNTSLWRSSSISALDMELAVEQTRSSRIAMVNQVRKNFYIVLLASGSYRIFRQSCDNTMENYLDIKRRYKQGTIAEYDLIHANVTVKNTGPNLLRAENSLTLVKWQLKALLDMDLDLNIGYDGQLADFKSSLFADYLSTDIALSENTDLKQLDLQAEQLKETLVMQKFDYLPTLSLTGLCRWSAINNDFKLKNYGWNLYSMVDITLLVPVFSGGSKFYKVKQTKVSIDQLNLQRDGTKRNLQLIVKQCIDNMNTCIKKFDAAQKGIEQTERGYMISRKRYDTGAGTWLEMNDAEPALTQARLDFNQSIYNYMIAKADLEKALGNKWMNRELKIENLVDNN